MNITVHHLNQSRSHRVLWMLEELGLDYEIREYVRDPKTMRAPPELKAVWPLGRAPVVEIDGVAFAESGAILDHLADVTDQLKPEPGTEAYRRYRYFLHYAEGSLMPPLLVRLITNQLKGGAVPFFVRPLTKGIANKIDASYSGPEIANHVAFLDGELDGRTFLAGDDLTAADIQMSYPVAALVTRGAGAKAGANIRAYLERLEARPAYQRAIDKGGPVMVGG